MHGRTFAAHFGSGYDFMSLQDQHLQQALKHAPDCELAPSDETRAAVLAYADKAVKCKQVSWLQHIASLLHVWSSWGMAGVGSAVATVLVVVVFWHELPDDTMSEASTLSERNEIRVADSAVERSPEVAPAEKSLSRALSDAAAPPQESSARVDEKKVVIDVMPSKAKSVSAVESRKRITNAGQLRHKSSGLAEVIPQTAPAPAVIELGTARAPVVVTSSIEAPSANMKDEPSKELQLESDASLNVHRERAMSKKYAAKSDVLGAVSKKDAGQAQESLAFLARIKNEGGKNLANQDIQMGNLRLLTVEVQSKDLGTLNCPKLSDMADTVDALTKFKVQSLVSCDATDSLLKEVEIYNQTMRNWHDNHSR